MNDGNKALQLVNLIVDSAIDGLPRFKSSGELANDYLEDASYSSNDARVSSLINWEASKNFSTGFITGLGGLMTLPASVPSSILASWVIQARLAGAIAAIYGHDLHGDTVRTLVVASLLGDAFKEVLKESGVRYTIMYTSRAIMSIPNTLLLSINQKVGFILLSKFGNQGLINLFRFIPVAGGVFAGTLDASACKAVGLTAKSLFRRKSLLENLHLS
ncbi:MAG: EcsC family protein [Candidatus Riflebacteria bacterium]|nr:EcsC family protein [Candidatus Riflebacteria bacterium]